MTTSPSPLALDEPSRRPVWLITLADLMLLLVGFFVFVHAVPPRERPAMAEGLRTAFGAAPAEAMAVEANLIAPFVPASAALPPATDTLAWAVSATRDPRTLVRVTGGTLGPDDRDAATGSAAILAADRARGIAAALVAAGVPADRIAIEARPGAGRAVQLHIVFAGETR